LIASARKLTRGGVRVEIGSRAFDLLVRLLQSRGEVVTKAEIMDHVWPRLFIEECNLRFQVAQLRKALGDYGKLIKTIPGRGYLFTAEEEVRDIRPSMNGVSPPGREVNGSGDGPPAAHVPSRRDTREPIVAIVDADDEANEPIRALLEQYGINVRVFRSAEEFLAAGLDTKVDLVILDVWLPGRTGLQLQADYAAAGALVPFIFVSRHADVDAAVRAMKSGASEFFTKPVRRLDLLEAVQRAVSAAPDKAGGLDH
jgi:DNA-binding response OmpR family regulator